ncbi:MAG: lyase family protein [Pseudomonadota bacterium]
MSFTCKSVSTNTLLSIAFGFASLAFLTEARASSKAEIDALFSVDSRNQFALEVEAAIATAQADRGVIPKAAAREIASKASIEFAPQPDITEEYGRVRHRMVALLNVWKRSLNEEARDYVHYGVTTVDVYDTVKILQLKRTIEFLVADMRAIEIQLMDLAEAHKETPMVGRTLGQHALPITFGKKVAVWASVNRRNIERLKEVYERIDQLGVLKGAVGTHLGLGPEGAKIERKAAKLLGIASSEPADWHGARDVFAEYALTLGLIAKSYAAIGGEVFRLQMTDIGEIYEKRSAAAIGSSTMPHKRNPSLSEALIHYGRTIPRKAEVLLDDVENAFERDNTSRPNRVLEEVSTEAASMVRDAGRLIDRLEIDDASMLQNLAITDGVLTAQRVVLHLAPDIGREEAEERVRGAAKNAIETPASFRDALLADPILTPLLDGSIDALLDPTTYLGLASEQVDSTMAHLKRLRKTDGDYLPSH